jgi:acyl carrier protein
MKDIREVLASVFRVKKEDISDKTEIDDIDSWDSLTHMEMIANLEQEFGIEFDMDEIIMMTNVAIIRELLSKKTHNGN